jgi:hypothetical protein
VTIYVNGTSVGTVAGSNTTYTNKALLVGGRPGYNSDTLLYNFSFIPDVIKYTTNFTPNSMKPSDLSNYALFLTSEGTTVIVGGAGGTPYNLTILGKAASYATVLNVTTSVVLPPGASIGVSSTICFVAGTPVLTDNDGYVPIEHLKPGYHTINNSKVLVVTESITPEKHLAVLPVNSLSLGVPSAETIMSLNHRIFHNDKWQKSVELTTFYVEYNKEVLFNVVLDKPGPMIVNNMTVETLDKENIIAQVFLKISSVPECRTEIIQAFNSLIETLASA